MRQHFDAPQVHPLYEKLILDWMFWQLSYEGGREYLERYLSKHEKELEEYHRDRVERGVYPNVVRSVVDTYTAHVYAEPVTRDTSEDIAGFHADINLQGQDADEFYPEVLTVCQIFGVAGVLTDRFEPTAEEDQPLTRAQEQELGIRPYTVLLPPTDIIDWETDRFGRMQWLIHRETESGSREPKMSGDGLNPRYKLWWPDRWELLEVRSEGEGKDARRIWNTIEEGDHPVGRVPVQFVYFGKRKGRHPLGESAIKDLAPMGRRIANLTSLIDEQAFQHVFNILAVPDKQWDELKKMNFSVAGAISFPSDTSNPPFYLHPDVSQLSILREELRETMMEARVLSGLGRQNEDSRAAVSGRSMAFQTMDKVALLGRMSERMAQLEHEVDKDAQAWMENTTEPEKPVYDTDFDPDAISVQLEEALLFDSFGIGGVAKRETLLSLARTFLGPKVEAEVLEEVLEDIKTRFTPTPAADAVGDLSPGVGGIMVDGDAADTALNGAQVQAIVEVGQLVSAGELAARAGAIILAQAFGWSEELARTFVEAATDIEPPEDEPPPQPPPATPEPPEPPPEPPAN